MTFATVSAATPQTALLSMLKAHFGAKNDAAIARAVNIKPPVISKLRHGKVPVTSSMLLRLHEATGMPVAQLRAVIAS